MIWSVTGHRPDKLGGYGPEAKANRQNFANAIIPLLLRDVSTDSTLIIGMAQGWDQAMAWACVQYKVPFVAAVPFKGQEDPWYGDAKLEYQDLLGAALRVEYVCEPGYHPRKMQMRNEWMINCSDAVVALWNHTGGGTANAVAYANSKGREVWNVWELWKQWPSIDFESTDIKLLEQIKENHANR